MEFLLFLGLALALGFKHAYDADHLVAVSNLLVRSRDLRRTSLMSLSWAAGHMVTASGITVILYIFRDVLLEQYLSQFELAVAVMLIAIGAVFLLWEFRVLHRIGLLHDHPHEHVTGAHQHPHLHLRRFGDHGAMFGIGIVHGLASNDELLVLLLASFAVQSLPELLGGIGVFSLGVVAGMVLFGVGMTYPLLKWGDVKVRRVVTVVTSVLSIVYGVLLLAGFPGFNPFG